MLKDFESFLKKKGTLKQQYVSFYIKWVSKCYNFLDKPLSTRLSSEQKKEFLKHIRRFWTTGVFRRL